MKIVSIVSSYIKNGNTNNIVKLIEDQIEKIAEKLDLPLKIERILLGDYGIQFCHGCRVCFDKGEEKCPLKDNLLTIRDKLLDADGIIIASPVYVEDINGIMKNWIDRMAFNNHRPGYAGKTAFLITTSGIGSSNHSIKTMKRALNAWGFYILGQSKFRTGSLMSINNMKELYNHKIVKIANKLIEALVKNRPVNPTFYSLLSFKVQQKYWQKATSKNNSIDYKYWIEKEWLKPKCEYYIKHNANRVKVKIARTFGNIIALFFR